MKAPREFFHSPKELPVDEFLSPGTSLCAGCGALATLRLVHKVLGGRIVIVNAAGCLTLLATYPFTPLRSSWLYTTMGSPSAGAQGIRDALDILKARGELGADHCEDLHVLVLAEQQLRVVRRLGVVGADDRAGVDHHRDPLGDDEVGAIFGGALVEPLIGTISALQYEQIGRAHV